MKISRTAVANGVSVLSAVFSALPISCCVFPIALSFLGASGLAFASALTPYRPYFIVLTLIALGAAFYLTYKPQKECAVDAACSTARSRKVQVFSFWFATTLVLILIVFPYLPAFLPI